MNEGKQVLCCRYCNLEMDSTILPKTDHYAGIMTIVSNPTCTDEGYAVQRCTECNVQLNQETLPALGHKGVWHVENKGTCVIDGQNIKICNYCQKVLETEVIPSTGHNYTEWEVVREATKEHEGERRRYCTQCGDTITETIEKQPKFLGIF